ncbi:YagK/YfjJ domain-containing protein [Burkholderia cepacia]|uniref:YagK/YfjJ domain-containing protein n=1 Tax=Burkholderia cepacia TaxID=292 RepID=UPI00158EA075|nr:inovirus-type Gp2 protein [Burkholderia cepacia]
MYNDIENEDGDDGAHVERIQINDGDKKHFDDNVTDAGYETEISDATRLDRRLNTIRLKDHTTVLLPSSHDALPMLDTLARMILKDDTPAFTVRYEGHRKRMKKASKLADYFGAVRNAASIYSSALTYPPHIELFFELYRVHPISCCVCVNPWQHFDAGCLEGEVMEAFRLAYRNEADRRGMRKKLDDWDRRSETNLARLKQYMNALFDSCSRIVTVRVDFYYHAAIIDPAEVNDVVKRAEDATASDTAAYRSGNDEDAAGNALARVDIKEIMRDRDRLFANMRGKPSLFQHMLGHVWRIEYSRVGGYHLHCALFFDGSKVRQHEWLAQQICDYWRDVITKGRGYAHNCNRNRYPDYVLGPTDYYDHDKRAGLLKCLAYLAKEDQLVYAKPSVKCKLFGTGRLPQPKGIGRKRTRE